MSRSFVGRFPLTLALAVLLAGCGTSATDSRYRPLESGAPATRSGPALLASSAAFAILDGLDDYGIVAPASSLDPREALTLEAWVFPIRSDNYRDYVPVILKSAPTSEEPFYEYGLFLRDSPDNPRAIGFQLALDERRTSVVAIESHWRYDAWNHVAATYDGTSLSVFVNGGRVASSTASGSITPYPTPLLIGSYLTEPQSRELLFRGAIDEVGVYGHALTQAQILAHYRLTPASTSYATTVRSEAPVAYYRFEADGPTMRDSRAAGNDGELRNGVTLGRLTVPAKARPARGS